MSNPVTVQPGGRSFGTIQSAIDSITDASEKNQYTVLCKPGTYRESVALKPWVFVEGMEQTSGNTIITNDAAVNNPGTVHGASNSGVTAYAGGSLKAIDCKIDGKVGKGVVVVGG